MNHDEPEQYPEQSNDLLVWSIALIAWGCAIGVVIFT